MQHILLVGLLMGVAAATYAQANDPLESANPVPLPMVQMPMPSPPKAPPPSLQRSPVAILTPMSMEDYPEAAIRNGEQGTSHVTITVGQLGRATACSSRGATPTLDQAACDIVLRRWRWKPALDYAGQPRSIVVTRNIRWVLPTDDGLAAPPMLIAGRLDVTDFPSASRHVPRSLRVASMINLEGKAIQCTTLETSGDAAVDAAVCAAITARFQFKAGLDGNGLPTVGTAISHAVWSFGPSGTPAVKLYQPEALVSASISPSVFATQLRTVRSGWQLSAGLDVDIYGHITHCDLGSLGGQEALNARVCQTLTERLRYEPSRNMQGLAQPFYTSYVLRTGKVVTIQPPRYPYPPLVHIMPAPPPRSVAPPPPPIVAPEPPPPARLILGVPVI